MEEKTLTACDCAVDLEEEGDGQFTLTILGGNFEPNVNIVGTLDELSSLIDEARGLLRARGVRL